MEELEVKIVVEEHLGLVRLCANRFKNRGIEYEELYSTGSLGLLKAAKSFDTTRGLKFSTYAVPVILGEIKRLFRDGGSLKVSRSVRELSLKVTRERESFVKEKGREATISELATILGVSAEDIAEALNVALPTISLTVDDDGEDEQLDIRVEAPDLKINNLLSLRQVLHLLEEKDKELIYLRYFKNLTQSAVGEKMGMSQVQVSRRETKILTFLKQQLE
ncbi:MAG: sigma-70 family RNA polymerase sigma factor [Oscillospiraceae bacterium]|jgi:RNA polymerase sporulation-specific sigma factor|nr:sigma-70 family RNA polymerase sigma factor [Oscillospiraceae bacterium]